MDSWIEKLWNNNKIFFFLLLPIILIVLFKDLLLDLVIGSARKILNDAKKKDEGLRSEQEWAEAIANEKKKQADELGKQAENVDEDENWHKRS